MSKDTEIMSEKSGVRTQDSEVQTVILKITHPCNRGNPFNGLTLVFSFHGTLTLRVLKIF